MGIDTRIGFPDEHMDQQGSNAYEELCHPMYATGIGLVIYGLLEAEQKEQQLAEEAVAHKEEPAEEQQEIEIEEEEKPKDKKVKGKKAKVDPISYGKKIAEWLAHNLTEDGMDD